MIELYTERLYLREMLPEDAADMFELNSDIEVIRYTGDTPFKTIQDAYDLLSNYDQYEKYKTGRLSVFIKETNEYIGFCGVKTLDDKTVDLGFRFHKKYWGKGYGKESSLVVIDYAFNTLGIKELFGNFMSDNTNSKKLLENLGFKPFGHDSQWQIYFLQKSLQE
jgi:RimJ/RimL family protein N-acetyltransferase